jgi:hypothetical protein
MWFALQFQAGRGGDAIRRPPRGVGRLRAELRHGTATNWQRDRTGLRLRCRGGPGIAGGCWSAGAGSLPGTT